MSDWSPATKEEVERAIEREADRIDPGSWQQFAHMLVDPYPLSIERFGQIERAYVVAKAAQRVVYFDDIEDDFGTAADVDGRLTDPASYGALVLALKQAAAGG